MPNEIAAGADALYVDGEVTDGRTRAKTSGKCLMSRAPYVGWRTEHCAAEEEHPSGVHGSPCSTLRAQGAADIEPAQGEWHDGDWADFNPVAAPRLVESAPK